MSMPPPPIPPKYRIARPEARPEESAATKPLSAAVSQPRLSHWEALFRLAMGLIILVSLGMAYWSFFHRLLPLQNQMRAMTSWISTMSSEIDRLESRWSREQVAEINAQYGRVYSQLFADQAALEGWLGKLQAQAGPLALDIKVALGQSSTNAGFDANLSVIPASISIEVRPEAGGAEGQSPYHRVLQFTQQLAAEGKRADLAELSVFGGVWSVSRAQMVFNLWAGDLGVEANNPEPTTSR